MKQATTVSFPIFSVYNVQLFSQFIQHYLCIWRSCGRAPCQISYNKTNQMH